MNDIVNILLVEDNPADVELTRINLEQAKVYVNLEVVNDGAQALQYLYRENEYADVVRPDMILLDLNLPKVNGREVLARIKSDQSLKMIPVIVLTSSEADSDIAGCYQLHANAYVTKPIGLDSFSKIVKTLEDFWLTVVKLPPKDE